MTTAADELSAFVQRATRVLATEAAWRAALARGDATAEAVRSLYQVAAGRGRAAARSALRSSLHREAYERFAAAAAVGGVPVPPIPPARSKAFSAWRDAQEQGRVERAAWAARVLASNPTAAPVTAADLRARRSATWGSVLPLP